MLFEHEGRLQDFCGFDRPGARRRHGHRDGIVRRDAHVVDQGSDIDVSHATLPSPLDLYRVRLQERRHAALETVAVGVERRRRKSRAIGAGCDLGHERIRVGRHDRRRHELDARSRARVQQEEQVSELPFMPVAGQLQIDPFR